MYISERVPQALTREHVVQMLRTILDVQPRATAGGAQASREASVSSLAQRLEQSLPEPLLIEEAAKWIHAVGSSTAKMASASRAQLV